MQKHIYKTVILFTIFILALFFMSKNIKEEQITLEKTVEMEDATFPLMYVVVDGYTLNRLHGYSSNIDANVIREAITPINQEKEMTVEFAENETVIKKIKYEIRTLKNNELLDSGTISALDVTDNGKSTRIKLEATLETSTEYAMKITVITDESRKINYYTRIKYYETDDYLQKKMDFVEEFHEKSLDKEKAKDLTMYLESDGSEADNDFAKVTIHSSFDMFSWGELQPKVLTEIVPTIKEFNVEIASIQLEYFVQLKNDSGTEVYDVKEFYRIRYTANRIYLLNYERTMESLFDIDLTSLAKSEFKIGVTNEKNMQIITSAENGKVSFVHGGELWYYNLPENRAIRVFSFRNQGEDYLRDDYDQHDIQILSMDDGGNMDFIVYGYMNRGDYEGKVALVLYHYSADTNRIKELVYIPLETTYQMLKEDMSDFSYVSQKGVFYFTIQDCVYSYNISSKKLKTIVNSANKNSFTVMKESHGIAWIDKDDAKTLHIMDLETEKQKKISAKEGEIVRIFGSIASNVIFGYVKEDDIKETTEGKVYTPAYNIEITDMKGNIVKTYQQKNAYIVDSEMSGNIIKLYRVKKVDGTYANISDDSILTQGELQTPIISVKTRAPKLMLTEAYLSLPDGFVMEKKPKVKTTLNAILSEDTTLHLPQEKIINEKYYVYAFGGIEGAFSEASDAIILADEQMGIVVNWENRLVFERSGKFNRKTIGQIKETMTGDGVDSVGACLYMVLQHNQISAKANELSRGKTSIYDTLEKSLEDPINLTGCTLDEVLYMVSNGSLVIAMKNDNNAIVITGYDESSVSYFDPMAGSTTIGLSKAKTMFENAGNIYISYMN
ncbi:MAG: hypothetical protein ACERKN_10730 [Velocimicrobium sp.]